MTVGEFESKASPPIGKMGGEVWASNLTARGIKKTKSGKRKKKWKAPPGRKHANPTGGPHRGGKTVGWRGDNRHRLSDTGGEKKMVELSEASGRHKERTQGKSSIPVRRGKHCWANSNGDKSPNGGHRWLLPPHPKTEHRPGDQTG